MRTHILKTLLRKEALRFRCNWGLLVMVAGVLALSVLLSVSARLGQLPGQSGRRLQGCTILYVPTSPEAARWAEHLRRHPPSGQTEERDGPLPAISHQQITDFRGDAQAVIEVPREHLGIQLMPTADGAGGLTYWYRLWIPEQAGPETLALRVWFLEESQKLLSQKPVQELRRRDTPSAFRRVGENDRVPIFVTGLCIFAFYLMSFNLYISSTGEERDKKALLALMLTPARPGEIIGAKVIFYTASSLLVSMAVVGVYKPLLLLEPRIWLIVFLGSVTYVAIGTIVLCVVRRQTTLNTISMIYLIFTALVMFMSVFLVPFFILKHALIENYLFRQLVDAVAGKESFSWPLDLAAMSFITVAWVWGAVRLFKAQGMKLAHVSR